MAQTMQNKPLAKKETAPAVKVNDLRAPKMATQARDCRQITSKIGFASPSIQNGNCGKK